MPAPRLMTWHGYARLDDGPWRHVCSGVSRKVCIDLLAEWQPAANVRWWVADKLVLPAGVLPEEATRDVGRTG